MFKTDNDYLHNRDDPVCRRDSSYRRQQIQIIEDFTQMDCMSEDRRWNGPPITVPGQTFKQKTVPTPSASDLQAGPLLVETLYISLDPVLRKWLSVPNNFLGIKVGHRMLSLTIARIGWVNYAVVEARTVKKVHVPEGAKVSDALGLFGHTGLSAYVDMLRIGRPKSGETVLVSAAAGAVGSVAAQIAKIQGARVVGIAGGEDKCGLLQEELGLDVTVDYKAPEFEQDFAQALDERGTAVYFDNAARAGLLKWLHEGRLRRAETVLHGGLELAPTALADLLAGKNVGKMILEIKAE
ncbi:putative secondary metabolism biosynthetic enzyme [Exophiala dermatitidis]|nr:putative secondary metabolism biosynthetic enzyme [Exophiala dermatitidis]KAJ4683246.1 putative secondary metabolism biosynthetic enzyme [Exophiala dermatitidis]KAJ9001692.1 putative secondary metabolism biosynthetic enzyme [Exophiala dermatitidis]